MLDFFVIVLGVSRRMLLSVPLIEAIPEVFDQLKKNRGSGNIYENCALVSNKFKKKSLDLDYEYYFLNKFINPVSDLLEPLVANPKETIFGDLIQKKPKIKVPYKHDSIENLFKRYNEK